MGKLLKPILFFALLAMYSFPVTSPGMTPQTKVQTGQWITSWLLCGPFPLQTVSETAPNFEHLPGYTTDFLKAHGGEIHLHAKEGQVEKFAGGSATWFRYTSPDSIIDLDAAVSKKEPVLAYAYSEIESPKKQIYLLALGTNDGGTAWLDGKKIWDHSQARGLKPDNDLVPVALHKGRNRLLLKIEERGNKWGFCARFLPFDTDKYVEQHPLFRILPHDDGSATLLFMQSETIIPLVLKNATLEIFTQTEPGHPVWRGKWPQKHETELPINRNVYDNYALHFKAQMKDGKTWTMILPFSAGKRIEYNLFDNGKTNYAIVIGTKASGSEQWAAAEMQKWLKKVSGADFPVHFDTESMQAHEIIIGLNEHSKKLLGSNTLPPADANESFTYKNVGPHILIWGGKQRGTMYGAMTFLERELGCRWYTPSVSVAPQKEKYSFTYLHHSESPSIRVRNDFYYEAFDPTWAARNKMNGAMNYRQQPGGVEGYWSVHTFYRFMPPSEFFEKHPEYYSLIDGVRTADHAQLCLTNPHVLDIITERLKETIRKNPQYLIYSVSQNDWHNPCQCDQCQAIVKKEGSEAGPMIRFVNQVAERIEKEFPHKLVGTLAYQYTRKPCKTLRPRHNVVVRLCSIECCFAHPFESGPENVSFMNDLNGWADIAPHLYIWDYVTNFSHYIMPYPNFRVLQPNIKTLRDHKAIGIMEQADYQSRGGEFAELRAYVLAKLLWNPECNVNQVINDFMYGYYGRSGQYVREYFDLLHNRITVDTHIHLGLTPDDKIFSDAFIRQADKIFDAAEAVAGNVDMLHRVEMARLPIMYLKCRRNPVQAKYDGTYQNFRRIVKREGITHFAERGKPQKEAFYKMVESAK
ncbi:MAG: DUF4838 domain-containing protein [Actinobacteria bacterium]|nr:DUF4838 domain-containing protein [Actinomycetota bacterium]